VIVELTREGRKKIEAALRADMEIENHIVSGLSESERAELVRLLRKLSATAQRQSFDALRNSESFSDFELRLRACLADIGCIAHH
jgi:hypothetical protein